MAHKKAGGSSRNGRDSGGQRLGVKSFGGQIVMAGNVLARQRGTKWHAGQNVRTAKGLAAMPLADRVEHVLRLAGSDLLCRGCFLPSLPFYSVSVLEFFNYS